MNPHSCQILRMRVSLLQVQLANSDRWEKGEKDPGWVLRDKLGRFGRGAATPTDANLDAVAKDLAFGEKGQKTAEQLVRKLADGDRTAKDAATAELNKLGSNPLDLAYQTAQKNLQSITDYVKDHPLETVAGIAIASATIIGAVLGAKKLRQKVLKSVDAAEGSAVDDAEKLAKKALAETEELQHFISDSDVHVMNKGFLSGFTWQGGKANDKIDKITDARFLNLFTGANDLLIQSEEPSVAIARQKNKLCLLVTGIQTGRLDRANRNISVSFAIESDIRHEERIRMLAAKALRGELDKAINASAIPVKPLTAKDLEDVLEERKLDYAIVAEPIRDMLASTPKAIANEKPSKKPSFRKVSKNTQSSLERMQFQKIELAAELERQKLPQQDGPLVIFTNITTKKKIEKAKVWKAVANFADVKS